MKRTYSLILSLFVVAMTTISCSNDDDTISQSSLAEITNFTLDFTGLNADDVDYELGTAIVVSVPYGTPLTGVMPTISVSENASISPASGEAISFEDGVAKTFTVTAEDGSTKTYTVTVNVRPEVGSGSRLKTYVKTLDIGGFLIEDSWSYEYDDASGFVNKLSVTEAFTNTVVYTLVYDDKNQVTEKTAEGERMVYTYEEGIITKAEEYEDGNLIYVYSYTYNENDLMVREERTNYQEEEPVLDDIKTYEYDANGNVIKYTTGTVQDNPLEATYDTKKNPFKSIYPKAYAAISVSGIERVNTNNPITRNEDEVSYEYSYEYNLDGYPLESSYSTTEADIIYTATYYAE